MNRTKIEWCDFTWNPVIGCTGGCPYCYARRMATRFHRDFTPHWEEKNFQRPFPREPSRIFVNILSTFSFFYQSDHGWVIVGAETGNREGKVILEMDWLREIWGFCQASQIPLFFKESLRHYWPAGAYFPQEYPSLQ